MQIGKILVVSSGLLIAMPVHGEVNGPYELVQIEYNSLARESAAPLCKKVVTKLNALNYEPPMACKRTFDPTYTYLPGPKWNTLESAQATKAALALEKSWAERGPPKEAQRRYASLAAKVEKAAVAGLLKVWQSRFDLANDGEKVRVVLESRGNYKVDGNCYYDTKFGVLLPKKYEVDPRYKNLSPYRGELFFYKHTTYIGVWSNVPSATLSDRAGPTKRHLGYLLVQSILPPGEHAKSAGAFDTVCQIGYRGLRFTNSGSHR